MYKRQEKLELPPQKNDNNKPRATANFGSGQMPPNMNNLIN